jgi:secreted Zn-dependent insulinase-like peptidase
MLRMHPFLRSSYKNSVLCGCYVYLIADALEKYTDDAGVAGLGYWLGHSGDSLNIAISGYTDKLADLLKVRLACSSNTGHMSITYRNVS